MRGGDRPWGTGRQLDVRLDTSGRVAAAAGDASCAGAGLGLHALDCSSHWQARQSESSWDSSAAATDGPEGKSGRADAAVLPAKAETWW